MAKKPVAEVADQIAAAREEVARQEAVLRDKKKVLSGAQADAERKQEAQSSEDGQRILDLVAEYNEIEGGQSDRLRNIYRLLHGLTGSGQKRVRFSNGQNWTNLNGRVDLGIAAQVDGKFSVSIDSVEGPGIGK